MKSADRIPWCDNDVVISCQRAVAEAEKLGSIEFLEESILRLSWALVHSRRPEDVQRGIAMLEASSAGTIYSHDLQRRERLFFLAVGHYRSGEYFKSMDYVDECLQIDPDWTQALTHQRTILDRLREDIDGDRGTFAATAAAVGNAAAVVGIIAVGIVLAPVGLVGWAASALSRKK